MWEQCPASTRKINTSDDFGKVVNKEVGLRPQVETLAAELLPGSAAMLVVATDAI